MNQGRNRRYGSGRMMPVWEMMLCHVLALGVALLLFALPHHVVRGRGVKVTTKRPSYVNTQPSQAPAPDDVPNPAQTDNALPQATMVPPDVVLAPEQYSWWNELFAETPREENGVHIGRNTRVEVREVVEEKMNYFVADIYVRNVTYMMGVFADDEFGGHIREGITSAATRIGSVLMINGDYYGHRTDGVCARNGVLYQNETMSREVCILYADGTMQVYPKNGVDINAEMENGAYHIWNFGPGLLNEDGTARTDFSANSDIGGRNPRTALGYIEPGHYLMVVVDGRRDDAKGMTLQPLAQLMESLGCKQAYNLDGGQTSQMILGTTMVNQPYNGGRPCSDYIAIVD